VTDRGPLLDVGRISKAHALRGEVVVFLTTDRPERLDVGTVLQTDHGPLTVAASRRHQQGWLVSFEGVVDREGADALHGVVLRAEPLDDPDVLWVHDLIGATVVDLAGAELGVVTSVEENPAADLLVLDGGALVPLTFVTDTAPGRVTVDIPEGLLDI
jgi:16S rRNA processing protein RimM